MDLTGRMFPIYESHSHIVTLTFARSAVLAGETKGSASFPGPLITGNKVCPNLCNKLLRDLTKTVGRHIFFECH